MRNYRNIKAWQAADDLTVAVYGNSRKFPREETYGLTSQIRRAASSVPANIVEGCGRESKKDYLHFLYIARGSLLETEYLLHLATRLEYLSQDTHSVLAANAKTAFVLLNGLIRSVEKEV